MTWDRVATTDELVVYETQYGNYRLRSSITGRFLPTTYAPDYGRMGYGDTLSLAVGAD